MIGAMSRWITAKNCAIVAFLVIYAILTLVMLCRMNQECISTNDVAEVLRKRMEEDCKLNDREKGIEDSANTESNEYRNHNSGNGKLQSVDVLGGDVFPNTVYYVWCGSKWFEFSHFLSIRSVMKVIRPDNLVFFYNVYPVLDGWMYNTWLKELREEFPFIRMQQLTQEDYGCVSQSKTNIEFVKKLIFQRGGMYVNEATIIAYFPQNFRKYNVVDAMDWNMGTGFIAAKKYIVGDSYRPEQSGIKKLECVQAGEYSTQNRRRPTCLHQTNSVFPKDIWQLDTPFGRLARSIFYGTSKIKRPISSNNTLVPNIAHVVWLGGGNMDFLFLLCVLSLLNVAKVEALYLHGDGPPRGHYWDMVKNHKRLHLVFRDYPGTVYGTSVNVLSHVTDVWRVDFMVKYGGIYVDTDTVFVRPLDERIRSYDAVATYDWTYWNHPFPDTINFGVSIGKRNAKFWHFFQESMKWFEDSDWSWNGLRQPYKIQERHPELVLIDPHLSVICFKSLCHPTWWPNYHNESIHHLNSDSIQNWRTDVFAFHWTLPTPYELLNHSTLLTTNSMFSEIGRYVLEQSNLLEHFRQELTREMIIARTGHQ